MSDYRVSIPDEASRRAARAALNSIQQSVGLDIEPEIKGMLAKQISGILRSLEISNGMLTHAGARQKITDRLKVSASSSHERAHRRFWRKA